MAATSKRKKGEAKAYIQGVKPVKKGFSNGI